MFNNSRFMVWQLIAIFTMLFTCCIAQAQNKLILIENGQAKMPIVVYKDAPVMTRLAAQDLADYIEKASGARPQIIEGWPSPVPEHAIWVGYQKGMETLFPKVDFDFKQPEEILIAANENHLVIAGRDRWVPDFLDVPSNLIDHGSSTGKIVRGVQQEYGTANAVYEFLHNQLGVRWLWPGEVEVPAQATIELSPLMYRYHPQLRSRMQMFWHLSRGRTNSPGNDESNWYRFNHAQLDSIQTFAGGHAFSDWWKRFSKTHPEYFALQPDGTRSGFPGDRTAKICESNPAVWEQWLKDVDATLAINPTQRGFTAAANDSWASGHCICENCRAWDDLNAPRRMFSWQGLAQEYVALSDRQVRFANTLARLLKKRYPDRDYYVTILAYGLSRPAPTSAVPDENVIISSVASFCFNPDQVDRASDGMKEIDQFKAWAKVAPTMYWRPNVTHNVKVGVPLSTRMVADHFKVLAEHGVIGLEIDTVFRYWSINAPVYYLMARLAWDPQQDAQAVLDDYFKQAFGPAAGDIKKYQELLNDAVGQHYADGNGLDGASWAKAYTPAFFDKTDTLMKQAAAKAGSDEKYSRRVLYFAAGLEFQKLQTQNRVLGDQINAGKGDKTDLLAQMTTNWGQIEAIAKAYPGALPTSYFTQIRKRAVPSNPAAYK